MPNNISDFEGFNDQTFIILQTSQNNDEHDSVAMKVETSTANMSFPQVYTLIIFKFFALK
jgi:hypothetical protein